MRRDVTSSREVSENRISAMRVQGEEGKFSLSRAAWIQVLESAMYRFCAGAKGVAGEMR